MNYYHKELQGLRDFIARARNTMATQKMAIEAYPTLGESSSIIYPDDDDFEPVILPSKKEQLEKILKLNEQMFEWIKMLDEQDKLKNIQ